MSKKPEGRSASINRNIRFAVVSTKPVATTKLQYNTRPLYNAPSANNESRRTITWRDFAQIERVINSRGQSYRVAPSPSADSSSAESTPPGEDTLIPAATERLLIRRSAERREKGERAEGSGIERRRAKVRLKNNSVVIVIIARFVSRHFNCSGATSFPSNAILRFSLQSCVERRTSILIFYKCIESTTLPFNS